MCSEYLWAASCIGACILNWLYLGYECVLIAFSFSELYALFVFFVYVLFFYYCCMAGFFCLFCVFACVFLFANTVICLAFLVFFWGLVFVMFGN